MSVTAYGGGGIVPSSRIDHALRAERAEMQPDRRRARAAVEGEAAPGARAGRRPSRKYDVVNTAASGSPRLSSTPPAVTGRNAAIARVFQRLAAELDRRCRSCAARTRAARRLSRAASSWLLRSEGWTLGRSWRVPVDEEVARWTGEIDGPLIYTELIPRRHELAPSPFRQVLRVPNIAFADTRYGRDRLAAGIINAGTAMRPDTSRSCWPGATSRPGTKDGGASARVTRLFTGPFDGHLDLVGPSRRRGSESSVAGGLAVAAGVRVADPDALARIAEADPAAASALLDATGELPSLRDDWPDLLAAELRRARTSGSPIGRLRRDSPRRR